ncbi:MAG: hypothetical protein D3926_05705 [Desulfobacteraceae bacterium]|nr:MAG: hypothetical protein D3926_05705 [Desulfobacteraceae bacterium]
MKEQTNTPQGKILRVKRGYNPNSSSMGSIIYALPVSLIALSGGFVMVSNLICSQFLKTKTDPEDDIGKDES